MFFSLVNIVAFVLACVELQHYSKRSLGDVVSVNFCILALLLYPLAMIEQLAWVNWISLAWCAYILGKYALQKLAGRDWKSLMNRRLIVLCCLILFLLLICWDRPITQFDDMNHWAREVKSLFYMNGLVGVERHCSLAYGDYPPIMQLLEWWFVHVLGYFREGLLFFAQYLFGFSFLLPCLYRNPTGRKFWAAGLLFILLPIPLLSVFNISFLKGVGVDAILGILIGGIVFSIFDAEKTDWFYFLRLASYLSFLALTKSTGMIWVVFLTLLFMGVYFWKYHHNRKQMSGVVAVAITPLLMYASWVIYCKKMGLTTYLTQIGLNAVQGIQTGQWSLPPETGQLLKIYVRAIFFAPTSQNYFGISALALMLLMPLLYFVLYKRNVLQEWEFRTLRIVMPLFSLMWIILLFFSMISIFFSEIGLDKSRIYFMYARTMARYYAPVVIGFLLSWLLLAFSRKSQAVVVRGKSIPLQTIICGVCLVIALPFCNYSELNKNFVKYMQHPPKVTDISSIEWYNAIADKTHSRVMVWGNASDMITYQYPLVPVSFYPFAPDYSNISEESEKTLQYFIDQYAFNYIYYEEETTKMVSTAQAMMENKKDQFEVGHLYAIDRTQKTYQLKKVY